MSKVYCVLFLSFAFCLSAASQTIKELQLQIANTKNAKKQVDLYNVLALKQLRANDKAAKITAEKSLALAREEGYKAGEVTAILQTVFIGEKTNSNQLQQEKLVEALAIAQSIADQKLIADCYQAFSQEFFSKAQYDKSIEYALKSLSLNEKINNTKGIIASKTKLAQVYQMREELPKAEAMLLDILTYPDTRKNNYSITLHTLANVYGMQGKYKEALAIDEIGLKHCDSVGSINLKSSFYDNMANCYMYSGNFAEAKKFN